MRAGEQVFPIGRAVQLTCILFVSILIIVMLSTEFNPRDSIGFQCSLTFRAFTSALERKLKGTGVSRGQFVALAHLIGLGPMTQSELASKLGIAAASIVRLVDRMERDGWVKRGPASGDRRVKVVSPTEKALEIWGQLSRHARSLLEEAYRGLPPDEIESAIRTLTQIRRNLGVK